MKFPTIAVFPPDHFARYKRLLEAMGALYSIRFEPREEGDWDGCAAALLFGVSRQKAASIAGTGLRCLVYPVAEPVRVASPKAALSFAATPYLDRSIRGRMFADQSIAQASSLEIEEEDEVIARKGTDVVWIHRQLGQSAVDILALHPPVLAEEEYPYEYLQRDNCMRLLPLIHFLRSMDLWTRPALRACFMFDDPNLHWKSYGYIKFKELARHASIHNYHVSFATVPFDGWYVHPATAALFRENKDRLSLLVHGNNHTFSELAQEYSDGDRQALMAQALRRIEKLERKTGLEVPRVMAAPHGGCSPEMADTLAQVGFEAASISRWSLMHYNRQKWHPTVGLEIAEFLGSAFPVIPRFKLAEEREADIYLAALLQKPIIMVGHHQDLRPGLECMEGFAERINSVGEVKWIDMKCMARSNFCTYLNGDTLHLKMFSRRAETQIPEGIRNVVIHRPWLENGQKEILSWSAGKHEFSALHSQESDSIATEPGMKLEIASRFPGSVVPTEARGPRTSIWAIARRGLCEVRDRAKAIETLWR